ncbi:MAG: L-histidine N(alpha)-methyltransferase [bacterium]
MKKIELITRSELESRFKECLEQRRMPDYFLYLGGSGVRSWLKLDSFKGFPIARQLTDLLRQSLPSLVSHFPRDLSLVSIGVGRGEKERLLLESLLTAGSSKYFAIDISSWMIDEALKTVADLKVDKVGLVAFLEDLPLMRQYWNPPVLLCLLGNTFCNFDPDYILAIIWGQLEDNDLVLLDCHLFPEQEEGEDSGREQIERVYRTEPNMRFNINPLVQRGFDSDNCVFHLELRPVETDVGIVYRTNKQLKILKNATILCGQDKVTLSSGDVIQLGFTYKYTRQQVEGYLQRNGFEKVQSFTSSDGENLLVLARKRQSEEDSLWEESDKDIIPQDESDGLPDDGADQPGDARVDRRKDDDKDYPGGNVAQENTIP